jgi:hypothetical protein
MGRKIQCISETSRVAKHLKVNVSWPVLFFIGFALLISCNSRVDVCLDIEASNFDVTGDRHDQELCNYPDMFLKVQYSWDTISFSTDSFYTNDLGQRFALTDVYVLVSQFALNGVEMGRMVVEDRTNWFLKDGSEGEYISVINDFTFVDRSKFSFLLGEWRTTDVVNRFDFFVGVPDTLTPTEIDSLDEDHVLRESRTYYNTSTNEFATARFIMARDSALMVLDTFVVSSGPIAFSFPLDKQLSRGRNDEVAIKIDFHTIFRDVDLDQDSTAIAMQLAANLENAITD